MYKSFYTNPIGIASIIRK